MLTIVYVVVFNIAMLSRQRKLNFDAIVFIQHSFSPNSKLLNAFILAVSFLFRDLTFLGLWMCGFSCHFSVLQYAFHAWHTSHGRPTSVEPPVARGPRLWLVPQSVIRIAESCRDYHNRVAFEKGITFSVCSGSGSAATHWLGVCRLGQFAGHVRHHHSYRDAHSCIHVSVRKPLSRPSLFPGYTGLQT